ncbi:Vacuolar ATPase assembly integral membrane protein VPH2 [Kluyveromyces marxianus]
MFDIAIGHGLLRQKLEELKEDRRASVSLQQEVVSFEVLAELYEQYWGDDSNINLEKLLASSDLRFKRKRVPGEEYTEEFKADLEKLRWVQKEQEYQDMIRRDSLVPAGTLNEHDPTISEINKEIKEQVAAVFNVLLTVFGTVYAVWYVTRSGWDIHIRIILCLFSGILVLIADAAMYNVYYRKIEEARALERKKKVVKKVIKRLI